MSLGIGLTLGFIAGWFCRERSADFKKKMNPNNWFSKDQVSK